MQNLLDPNPPAAAGGLAGQAAALASTDAPGLVRLTTAPDDPTVPTVVTATDPRLWDARNPKSHSHVIDDVTGLGLALDSRAPAVHGHDVEDVIGLADALADKVDIADGRLTDARVPLDHGHELDDVSGLTAALQSLTSALAATVADDDPRLTDARTPLQHGHAQSEITGLTSALSGKVDTGDARLSDARTPIAVPTAGALVPVMAAGIIATAAGQTGTARLVFGPEVAAAITFKANSAMRVQKIA